MRVAVTGTEGQLVRSLIERGRMSGIEIVAIGRPGLDLSQAAPSLSGLMEARPDAIVNAAAYTAVDKAEGDADLAMRINGAGARAVAEAAAALRVPVLQISTDYVFDGDSGRPYRPDDPTAPLGAYGRSKFAGEQAVAAATPNHAILRTAWVYSPFGTNFVKTMLRLAGSRHEVSVVSDQRGCPTSALDLADGVLRVARNLVEQPGRTELRGIFHMVGTGEADWASFAEATFRASADHGGPRATVTRIATADYPTPARRPANSRLDGATLAAVHGVALPPWTESLRICVARLVEDAS